jgi:hypothetical protein
MVWEPVLDLFENEITEKGYFYWDKSFQAFKREFSIDAPLRAPQYLSLDFYAQQRNELTELGWYVIRLGRGNFGIFNEDKFPKPYLELPIENAEEIEIENNSTFYNMRKAFKSLDYSLKSAENSLLELARFYGIFGTMVETIDNSREYQIGPRGLTTQRFKLYFKKIDDSLEKFEYNGQVELDYSIWTENRVFVVEAKSITNNGRDIGWHKMAFPSRRFVRQTIEDGLFVTPVYFLRTRYEGKHLILIYVFTEMKFKEEGIILNDENRWKLLKVFKVDINSIDKQLR